MPKFSSLKMMLDKLQRRTPLSAGDRAAVLALPHTIQKLRSCDFIERENDQPSSARIILAGFAIRHKIAQNGRRQIFSIHMKGELIGLDNLVLRRADHNIQALTQIEVAVVPLLAMRALVTNRPQVSQAMWDETLVDAAILREWMLNVGRRDARARIAHMLCEFALRLSAAGLGSRSEYDLPMTQEQLGDALGLTSVHINRTLQALESDGLIRRTARSIRIAKFGALARIGDFDSKYLNLDRIE